MKNLDQIRAAAALKFWAGARHRNLTGASGREVLRQATLQLLSRGLLATAAMAQMGSSPDHPGAEDELLRELGQFMASRERGLLSFSVRTTADLVQGLANGPSIVLHQALDEAVAYLSYLIRLQPH
jgi:hypothetical protein